MRKTAVFSAKKLSLIGLAAAATCILGPLSIPIPVSPVPITLTNLVILLNIYILGYHEALTSLFVYLALGIAGLPVFSGFSGGLGKLAGPTGGYLIGFIFLVLIAGFFIDRFPSSSLFAALGIILGMTATYGFGTLWLAAQMDLSLPEALSIGVLPYLAGDAMKILLATLTGPRLQKRLAQFQ
ncbi:biotin transporter BioY [Lachnospiraceae bacterium KGMB03038]|nr:biotin transporter BioY [Lachnospiraceae bacterium KGMB03038]